MLETGGVNRIEGENMEPLKPVDWLGLGSGVETIDQIRHGTARKVSDFDHVCCSSMPSLCLQ